MAPGHQPTFIVLYRRHGAPPKTSMRFSTLYFPPRALFGGRYPAARPGKTARKEANRNGNDTVEGLPCFHAEDGHSFLARGGSTSRFSRVFPRVLSAATQRMTRPAFTP